MTHADAGAVRIGISGVRGRMGQVVASQVAADPAYTLVGGIVKPGSAAVPLDAIRLETSVEELLPDIDVLIDVSLADATGAMVDACRRFGTPLVCGVTGLDDATMQHMRAAAEHIPVWYARNLSHGVGVLLRMLPALASELAGYDVSIVERHHRHKRDAPSGTALAMALAFTGEPGERPIDIQSVRAGGITGEHDVTFTNDFEEIRVSHRALDRAAFAAGAVRAAGMLSDAAPGWYGPES